jgi:hypothetical protein
MALAAASGGHREGRWRSAVAYSNKVPEARALNHPTYWLIHRRLKDLGIDYTKFYERDLTVYESKLDGISFITKKVTNPLQEGNDFLTALRLATRGGRPAFREGKKFENEHWAVDASMGATTGIGFREIMYLDPPKKWTRASDPASLRMNPQADPMFTSRFDSNKIEVEISSLHAAVWGDLVKVHVDETGFILQPIPGMSGDVSMTADFLQHTLLELIWKDTLKVPGAIEIFVPNSANQFSAFGAVAKVALGKSVKLQATAQYNIRGQNSFSATATLTVNF